MSLLSAEDLERLGSTEANIDVRVAAIANSFATLTSERDALAAELGELRAGIDQLRDFFDLGEGLFFMSNRFEHADTLLRALAAQPQGERGKALLAVVEAAQALSKVHGDGRYCDDFCKGIRAALAAIDGAQPERCHAGGDGDCDWPECPQKTTYQQWCPLARRDGSAS